MKPPFPRQLLPLPVPFLLLALAGPAPAPSAPPLPPLPPRCELIPLPGDQVSFQIDGEEKLRWHFSPLYPRPFFFPFTGPGGGALTRMGHPGAPNHDHHRSIWFGHQRLEDTDFWSDRTTATVRQQEWLAYQDGDGEAIMACILLWQDGSGAGLLRQELIASLLPADQGEFSLELQSTFSPPPHRDSVTLGKTNFGFLAVRVARSISGHFGGGTLSNSEGARHETEIFARPARWMDYSGPVITGHGSSRQWVSQGITYFDHPSNPRYPSPWHVREDGWMGAAPCLEEDLAVSRDKPLRLRYLLHAHLGNYCQESAESVHRAFTLRPPLELTKSPHPHTQWLVQRTPSTPSTPHAP